MTAKEIHSILKKWEALYFSLDAQCDAIEKIFGSDFDTPFEQAVWSLWRAYTDEVALRIGDIAHDEFGNNWLLWYWQECDMGKTANKELLKVAVKNKEITIKGVKQLAEIIVQ